MDVSKQPVGVGARVAERRKLNGLTQAQLAHRAHVSLSLVRKVEQGSAPASPAFTAAVATALRTTVAELYDQPSLRYGAERDHIAEVETAVMEGPASVTAYRPPDLDVLAARVDEIAKLQRRSRYHESSALMPSLLAELHTTAALAPAGAHSERAHHLLATLYGCVVICLHRLASPLVSQAAERAAEAARFSGDPLLAALCDQERALPLMYRGAYDTAQRIVTRAQEAIADQPTSPEALSARGAMHLRSAIIAARKHNAATSDAHLAEARDLASHLPLHANLYDTAFCTPNVQIHSVAAAVEMQDGTTAVTRDTSNPLPPGTMRSRVAHHNIDLGRAWLLHGDHAKALEALNIARRTAPQQTRYHPMVAETVLTLARSERRRSDTLSSFAAWMGITG
ncbi:MAG TPA: helix-turn-helix domain-containing protein [Pseudonocardiaceae bacterium]|nr:helix-turn-helix domain-containing protein [Pseudonocardiaceae bacterium]